MPKSSSSSPSFTKGITLQSTGAAMSTYGVSLSNSVITFLYVMVLLAFLVNLQEQSAQFSSEVQTAHTSLLNDCWDTDVNKALAKSQKKECREYWFTYTRPAMSTVLRRSMQCIFVLKPLAWLLFQSEPTLESFTGSPANHNNQERTDWMWSLVTILANYDLVKTALVLMIVTYVLSKAVAVLAWFNLDFTFLKFLQDGSNTTSTNRRPRAYRTDQGRHKHVKGETDEQEEEEDDDGAEEESASGVQEDD